jgi:hypothetical protein
MNRMPKHLEDYVPVNVRIQQFREMYPEGRIITNCELITQDEDLLVKASATLYVNNTDVIHATGHSLGLVEDVKDELEKLETKAVGRALGFLGISADESIASREDMEDYVEPAPKPASNRRSARKVEEAPAQEEVVEETTEEPQAEEKAPRTRHTRKTAGRRVR